MNEPPDLTAEAKRWLEQARQDLHAAGVVQADPRSAGRIACFLAHLAAEKALKAALISRGIAFRKVHDLPGLLAMLPPRESALFDRRAISELNPWVIEGRYAEPGVESDSETARRLVGSAAKVLEVAGRLVAGS